MIAALQRQRISANAKAHSGKDVMSIDQLEPTNGDHPIEEGLGVVSHRREHELSSQH